MRQRLLDYKGDMTTRRQARARDNRHTRDDPISQERKTAKQIITKARKSVLGKAIKTFTPTNTQLTDQQKREYVPFSSPVEPQEDGASPTEKLRRQQRTSPQAPHSGTQRTTCMKKHTKTGRRRTMARIRFNDCAHRDSPAKEESTPNKSTNSITKRSKPYGPEP